MILVDSSVWIDWFANRDTVQTVALERFVLEERDIAVGDLILMEVLQGARSEQSAGAASVRMAEFSQLSICNPQVAIMAARFYRSLRAKGITPRKTIDTLIATRCVIDNFSLLYSDRDFDPFVTYFGLRSALDIGVN